MVHLFSSTWVLINCISEQGITVIEHKINATFQIFIIHITNRCLFSQNIDKMDKIMFIFKAPIQKSLLLFISLNVQTV